jgi:hypothetical protein
MLNPTLVRKISQEVYRRFPETAGAVPTVRTQKAPNAEAGTPPNYLLSFKGTALTQDQRKINTVIRVVVNELGRILKISSSR